MANKPKKKLTTKAAENPQQPSRSAFIRSLPVTMPAAEVVKKGSDSGLTFRTNLVYEVRRAMKKKSSGGAAAAPSHASHTSHGGGLKPVSFGHLSREEGLLVAAILEIGLQRSRELFDSLRHMFER